MLTKLTLPGSSILRATSDELPSIVGLLVNDPLGKADRA
jgi:hypothetical protein